MSKKSCTFAAQNLMYMKTKLFTFLFTMVVSTSMLFAESGTCGQNLTWNLTNSVLTISGTGAMDNYFYESDYGSSNNDVNAPWYSYGRRVDTVIINEGITKIGNYAFFRSDWFVIKMLSDQPCELGVNIVRQNGEIIVDCEAIDSYHTAWDNYLVGYNGYNVGWKEFHPFSIHGPKSPYTITTSESNNGYVSSTPDNWSATACDETIQVEAEPSLGYYFSKWADGKTENPRTIEFNSDITLPSAIFEPYTEGKCGPNLTWKYDNHTLTIQGSGEMWCDSAYESTAEEYQNEAISWAGVKNEITKVVVSDGATNIGSGLFYEYHNLKDIYIGSTVKSIGWYAFADCNNIKTITCYGTKPPVVRILLNGSSGYESFPVDMPNSTIVYVSANYVGTYKAHDFWGQYDVRPIETHEAIEDVEGDNVKSINKLIHNGQILILRGSKIYNLQGQEVR